jgi:hypothetical protein
LSQDESGNDYRYSDEWPEIYSCLHGFSPLLGDVKLSIHHLVTVLQLLRAGFPADRKELLLSGMSLNTV